MKKLITIIVAAVLVIPASANLFIKVGGGYGLGNQKYLLEQIYNSPNTENIYASFGGNLGFFAGVGIDMNEHIELGADLGFENGRSISTSSFFYDKTYTGRLIYLSPSLTYKTILEEDFTPYARLGIFTGLPIMNLDVNGDLKKFRGGFPLGYNGAIGSNYNISDNIKLFGEIYSQSMLYTPSKRKESGGGVVQFTDVLADNAPVSTEIRHHFFSFGAIGINIGLKIVL